MFCKNSIGHDSNILYGAGGLFFSIVRVQFHQNFSLPLSRSRPLSCFIHSLHFPCARHRQWSLNFSLSAHLALANHKVVQNFVFVVVILFVVAIVSLSWFISPFSGEWHLNYQHELSLLAVCFCCFVPYQCVMFWHWLVEFYCCCCCVFVVAREGSSRRRRRRMKYDFYYKAKFRVFD